MDSYYASDCFVSSKQKSSEQRELSLLYRNVEGSHLVWQNAFGRKVLHNVRAGFYFLTTLLEERRGHIVAQQCEEDESEHSKGSWEVPEQSEPVPAKLL